MKSITRAMALAVMGFGMATTLQPLSVLAENLERSWKTPDTEKNPRPTGFLNSFLPSKSKPVRAAAPTPGTINIARKKKPKKKLVARKSRTRKKKPTRAGPVASVTVAKNGWTQRTANWWETVGNPVVYAFRDCSVGFARQQAQKGVTASPATVITAAMKSTCQVEFAKMAGVMIGGLGEKKSNAMLIELAKTTFLPTVKAAMAVEKDVRVAKANQVSKTQNLDQMLGTAKAEMFRCFSERTDRLAVAKTTQANTIADAVLIGCREKSDVFFDLLFANSKASPQVKLQQKNIALNETYKIAIIRRVLVSRKPSQVKTATQQ